MCRCALALVWMCFGLCKCDLGVFEATCWYNLDYLWICFGYAFGMFRRSMCVSLYVYLVICGCDVVSV